MGDKLVPGGQRLGRLTASVAFIDYGSITTTTTITEYTPSCDLYYPIGCLWPSFSDWFFLFKNRRPFHAPAAPIKSDTNVCRWNYYQLAARSAAFGSRWFAYEKDPGDGGCCSCRQFAVCCPLIRLNRSEINLRVVGRPKATILGRFFYFPYLRLLLIASPFDTHLSPISIYSPKLARVSASQRRLDTWGQLDLATTSFSDP